MYAIESGSRPGPGEAVERKTRAAAITAAPSTVSDFRCVG
jgi:hypothetical protein